MRSSGRSPFSAPVDSLELLEIMRTIYNQSLEGMATKPLKPVTKDEQMDWWLKGDGKRAWIVSEGWGDGVPQVGFIVLTDRIGFETPMFAIAPEYRGMGYARWFIQEYIALARGALAGEQLQSNEIICRLNKEAGWEILFSENGVDYLHHPGSSRDNAHGYLESRAGLR